MIKISTKKFDPANWPEGIWGKYTDGVRLKIRKINGEVLSALRKPFVRMMPAEKVDSEAFNEAMTEYIIEEFEGLGDEEGNPLPLSLASKKSILNDLSLRDWIWEFARAQEVIAEKAHQEEIKNS